MSRDELSQSGIRSRRLFTQPIYNEPHYMVTACSVYDLPFRNYEIIKRAATVFKERQSAPIS